MKRPAITILPSRQQIGSHFALGVICTLMGGTLWGFSGACGQYIFTLGATPLWLINIRLLIAGAVLTIYTMLVHRDELSRLKQSARDVFDLIIYGLVGISLCQFSYFITISLSDAATACILQYLSPILIVMWTCLATRRLPFFIEVVAVIGAVVGVFCIVTHGAFDSLVIDARALFWGLMSAVAVAVYTIQPRRLLQSYSETTLLGIGMLVGGMVSAPVTQFWHMTPPMSLQLLAALVCIILVGTIISFSLFMKGVKLIGSVKAGVLACIEPVSAVIIVNLWLGTTFTGWDVVGFILLISTVLITSLPLNRHISKRIKQTP